MPGATAACLSTARERPVDYASELVPFYARVAAAHLRIVTGDVQRALDPSHGSTHEITIRCKGRTFFVRSLPDGYALVVVLKRRAFSISPRALAIAERDLSKEAGWPAPAPQSPFWNPIQGRAFGHQSHATLIACVCSRLGSRWMFWARWLASAINGDTAAAWLPVPSSP